MKLQKLNNQKMGYAYPDAVLAICMIAQGKDISIKEMAKTCHLAPSTFAHYLSRMRKDGQLTEYGREYLGHTSTGTHITDFKERDLHALCAFLGKQCGEETGFDSVAAMILYAQQHYVQPEGKRWVRQDYDVLAAKMAKNNSGQVR